MNGIAKSVTFREVNHGSGRIMKQSRERGEIVPVTYGSDADPFVYIVPNDPESVQALIKVLMDRKIERHSRSQNIRSRLLEQRVPMGGSPAKTLDEMRLEESN